MKDTSLTMTQAVDANCPDSGVPCKCLCSKGTCARMTFRVMQVNGERIPEYRLEEMERLALWINSNEPGQQFVMLKGRRRGMNITKEFISRIYPSVTIIG